MSEQSDKTSEYQKFSGRDQAEELQNPVQNGQLDPTSSAEALAGKLAPNTYTTQGVAEIEDALRSQNPRANDESRIAYDATVHAAARKKYLDREVGADGGPFTKDSESWRRSEAAKLHPEGVEEKRVMDEAAMIDPVVTMVGSQAAYMKARQRDDKDPSVSKIFIDLDNFKQVNDLLGHSAGNEALILMGTTIVDILLHNSINPRNAFRNGGDEFILHLHNDMDRQLAQRILSEIEQLLTKRVNNRSEDPSNPSKAVLLQGLRMANFGMSGAIGATAEEADNKMYVRKREKKPLNSESKTSE